MQTSGDDSTEGAVKTEKEATDGQSSKMSISVQKKGDINSTITWSELQSEKTNMLKSPRQDKV